jgi:protein-disulfide isomerase
VRAALALLVAVAALVVPSANAAVPGAADVNALLRGIPQQGPWLGKKTARLVLVEYVDPQCPYCAVFSRQTLPPVIRSYVRTGKVRILFRGLSFVGPESTTALRWMFGAGAQNKLWNVAELLFVNQGGENEGWVTQSLLNAVARSVPALDLARLRKDAPRTGLEIASAAAAAEAAKVPGTPYLQVGRSLSKLQPLRLKSFESRDLAAQLDALLK